MDPSNRTHYGTVFASVLAAVFCLISSADAQEHVSLGKQSAKVVVRQPAGTVLKCEGAEVESAPRQSRMKHEWYIVQDSMLGVVFDTCSGLKESNKGDYDGDITLRALTPIEAVEIRSITFDAWKEFTGVKTAFEWAPIKGESRDFDPRWYDIFKTSHRHLISITWVSRVRHLDGSIVEADPAPVLAVARKLDEDITADSLQVTPDTIPKQVAGIRERR